MEGGKIDTILIFEMDDTLIKCCARVCLPRFPRLR